VTFTGTIYGAGLKTQQEWKAVSEDSLALILPHTASQIFILILSSFSLSGGRITSYHITQHQPADDTTCHSSWS
jgi:hypothetical protein